MVDQSSKNIKLGTIITYITQFLSIGISFIYVPIMLGILGQAEYGLYALVQSIISYLQMSEMGIGTTATRYNSKYIAEGDKEGQKTINGMFLVIYVIIAICCCMVGSIIYYCLPFIYSNYSDSSVILIKKLFLIALFNLVITFVFKIFDAIILAYEKFVFVKILSLIQTILGPIGMLFVLYMGNGSVGMLLVTTTISLVFGLVQMLYCFTKLGVSFQFNNFKKELFQTIMSFTFFVFLNSMAHQLFSNSDKIIVSILMSETAVAVYAVVLQFDIYFYNFTNVISGFYLPRFTKMVSQHKGMSKDILNEMIRTGRIQLIIAGLIFGGFIAVGEPFIMCWVGPDYSEVYFLTIVLFGAKFIASAQSMFNSLMQAMNLHKMRAVIGLSMALLKVFMTIIFVNKLGLSGCVIAYIIAYFLRLIVYNLYYKKRVGIDVGLFWKKTLCVIIPICILIVVLGILFRMALNTIPTMNYFTIVISVCIYSVVYIAGMWFTVFNNYEKDMLKKTIRKVKK